MQPDDRLRLIRLESQVAYLLAHLGIDPATAASDWSAAGPPDSPQLPGDFIDPIPRPGPVGPMGAGVIPPQIADAIQRGRAIQAIKMYREATGVGLKEAKAAVEAMARDMGIRM
jgi:Ribosomal protein L7/L12 C-terminal domain